MRRALVLAALMLSGGPAACAFLLDFDELQKGDGTQPPQDGATDSTCNCVTEDPCKPSVCENGQCVTKDFVGLAEDGYSAAVIAPKVHRVTLATKGSAFYGSVFYDDGGPKLRLFKSEFGAEQQGGEPAGGKLTTELPSVLPALTSLPSAIPSSAAGLTDVGDSMLAAFGISTGGVYYVKLDGNLSPIAGSGFFDAVTAQYETSNPQRHPHAWTAGPNAFVGWITTGGVIRIPFGAVPIVFGGGSVTDFAPLLSSGGAAVAWREGGMLAQHQDQATPLQLDDCPEIAQWSHFYLANFGLPSPVRAANIVGWTKTNGSQWSVQSRSVSCGPNDCLLGTTNPICPDDLTPGIRTFSALIIQIPEQESYYIVQATSSESGGQRQVILSAAFVQNATATPLGSPIELSPREPLAQSADWPAIAYSGGDKVMAAWIQTRSDHQEAQVRRFRLCLPP